MRTAGILVVLLSTSAAHADRNTVMMIGGTFAGTSLSNETQNDPSFNGGARFTLAFEDAPLPVPGVGLLEHEGRIVPELFAGFYLNDQRIRGQLGAGLRAELQLARGPSATTDFHMRTALYVAARAKISGPDAKPGAEFMIGEYLLGDTNRRIGWEGGLGVIKRPDLTTEQSPELEALVNIYVGWN